MIQTTTVIMSIYQLYILIPNYLSNYLPILYLHGFWHVLSNCTYRACHIQTPPIRYCWPGVPDLGRMLSIITVHDFKETCMKIFIYHFGIILLLSLYWCAIFFLCKLSSFHWRWIIYQKIGEKTCHTLKINFFLYL